MNFSSACNSMAHNQCSTMARSSRKPHHNHQNNKFNSMNRIFMLPALILLFSTFCLSTQSAAVSAATALPLRTPQDCRELSHSHCQCSPVMSELEIACPPLPSNWKINIRISPSNQLMMECNQINTDEYKLLPETAIGFMPVVKIKNCPLPGHTPISRILDRLGAHQVNTLLFECYELGINLTRQHLSGLHNLGRLRFNSKSLSHLPEDLFKDMKNLTWLDFRSNNTELPLGIFDPLENVETLELVHNHNLNRLPAGIFRKQHKLRRLYLWGNQLQDLNKEVFLGATTVSDLDLSANGIETLQHDVFAHLTNLSELNLSANRFRELPRGLFAHNKNLSVLRFINNRVAMRTLPPALFSNLPFLTDFRLSTDLEDLPEDLFVNSTGLTKIDLSNNRLSRVPGTLLLDQQNLLNLDLSNNFLSTLPDEFFQSTRKLKILKISGNLLTTITESVFSQLVSLEALYLNDNRLSLIEQHAFDQTQELTELYLQNNHLDLTTPASLEPSSPFNLLTKLEILNLRNNSIMYIFNDWKFVLLSLRELDLSYNNLTWLSEHDIHFLTQRALTLDFSHNQIHTINFSALSILKESEGISKTVINLNSNPLICDCVLPSFVRFIRGDFERELQETFKIVADDLYCREPANLRNVRASEVALTDLLCPMTDDPICPKGCDCWARSIDRTLIVNCTNGNRTEIPRLANFEERQLDTIELNLENNHITKLPSVLRNGYAHVSKLYLAGNSIQNIEANQLPRKLRLLDVRHNNIQTLNDTVLRMWNASRMNLELKLSENPWLCDCNAKGFLTFVQSNYEMIRDLELVQCLGATNKNRKFNELSISDICPAEKGLIVAVAVIIALFGFLIGLVAALYYKYNQEIKVWLYAHNMCLWFVTEEELDKDKKYDAFISYSHKDEHFVKSELMPHLEGGPYPFKVCEHGRDWLIGDCIPDQIVRSVEDSRRTIVVLSQNFIESMWGRMEFRAAHQAGMDEKRTRVIVIILGDLGNMDKMDSELKAYLRMNTYLKWGDPWFWNKLMYAMPHSKYRVKHSLGNGALVKHPMKSSTDDKLELIKPSAVTPPLTTTPPSEQTKNPLIAHLNGGIPQTAVMVTSNTNGKAGTPTYYTNGKITGNGHINGAFIINANAKQSDV